VGTDLTVTRIPYLELCDVLTNQIIEYVHDAKASGDQRVRYPGERTMEIGNQNLAEGVPVEAHIWQSLQDM